MIKIKELSNGIRLVLDYIPQVQSVSLGFWVGTGAVNEVKEYAGISHFTEHMMFKGTPKRNFREIAQEIDSIGGQMDAFTGKETTCYYVRTIESGLKTAMDVFTDMLTNSLFDKKEMDRERKVIGEEIKMSRDAADDVAVETACELVFKGRAMGNSILGTPSSIKRITPDVMRAYVKDTYSRDKLVISVSGNFDEKQIEEYFSHKFSKYRKTQRIDASDELSKKYKQGYKCVIKDIEQAHICLATESIALSDDRFFALSILSNIMGGSMSSRFFQNIREEKGLAYSVYCNNSPGKDAGYFSIYAGVAHSSIEKTLEAIKYELDDLKKRGITEQELEYSRRQLTSAYVFAMESTTGRMFRNGRNVLLRGTAPEETEIIKKYEKVTMADIEIAKEIICNFSSYSACIVTDNEVNVKEIMS